MMSILDELIKGGACPEQKSGHEYSSPCPGCGGHDRFIVWVDKDRYWCRQCQASGDLIQYFIDFGNLSYVEARAVAEKKVDYSPLVIKPAVTNTRLVEVSDLWSSKASEFMRWGLGNLKENRDGILDFLFNERGISSDLAIRYNLGYCPGNIRGHRYRWGLSRVLKSDGSEKVLWLPKGLIIPRVSDGKASRIRFRLPNGEPRYYVVPGSSMEPAFFGDIYSGKVVMVESELDGILLHGKLGSRVLVMASGSVYAQISADMGSFLTGKDVFVAYDNDMAGINGALRECSRLGAFYLPPVIRNKDVTDMWKSGIDLVEWFESGLRDMDIFKNRENVYKRVTGLKKVID